MNATYGDGLVLKALVLVDSICGRKLRRFFFFVQTLRARSPVCHQISIQIFAYPCNPSRAPRQFLSPLLALIELTKHLTGLFGLTSQGTTELKVG